MAVDPDIVVLDPGDPEFASETSPLQAPGRSGGAAMSASAASDLPSITSAAPAGRAGDEASAAGTPVDPENDVLDTVTQRSIQHLVNDADAQTYLRDVGLTNPATLTAFRLGSGGEVLTAGMENAALRDVGLVGILGRCALRGLGVNLPTYDPRRPTHAVGLIRLTPAQHIHRFVTPPVGIACPADIGAVQRIVLVDNPLLGLRLAQAGVPGIAIVEDNVVLGPLLDWLAHRTVLIAGWRQERIVAMKASLGTIGDHAVIVPVCTNLAHIPKASLIQLGLTDNHLRPPPGPQPPITPLLLDQLHRHAMANVQKGEGAQALQALGITDAVFATTFQIGYLAPTFRNALTPSDRHAFLRCMLGGNIVVPAVDDQGTVVDLLAVQPAKRGHTALTLFDRPRGLIGAHVITAFDEIVVTDQLRWAARYAVNGRPNVVILRNVIDAQANVARLVRAGIRRAEVHGRRGNDEIAAILTAAGIAVTGRRGSPGLLDQDDSVQAEPVRCDVTRPREPLTFPIQNPGDPQVVRVEAPAAPPAPPPPPGAARLTDRNTSASSASAVASHVDEPTLTDHDPQSELAVFRCGDLAYAIQVPWDDRTIIQVRASRGDRGHTGEIDIALEQQRRRFAIVAADRIDVPASRLAHHLAIIHAALPALVVGSGHTPAHQTAAVPRVGADRDAALATLRAPDLLDRIVCALGDLGWHGEEETKRLMFLVAVSRKLDSPAWMVLTGAATSGPPMALHTIADATPPEDLIQVTRLTDHALLHTDPEALTHRLLVIDDLERISASVATNLRVLRARGALSATQVERDPLHGAVRTRFIQAHGPVALLGAARAGSVPDRLAACLIDVPVDESVDHVEAALAAERRRCADPAYAGRGSRLVTTTLHRLHEIQRCIDPRPVVLPDANAVAFPAGSPSARRDQQTVLALASACALLHQHQRLSENSCIIATASDIALGRRLAALWDHKNEGGLSRIAAQLLAAVRAGDRRRFTMNDCATLVPGHDRSTYRTVLDELIRTEYLVAPTGGRGKVRHYHLLGESGAQVSRYDQDVPSRQVGELVVMKTNFPPTVTPDEKVS